MIQLDLVEYSHISSPLQGEDDGEGLSLARLGDKRHYKGRSMRPVPFGSAQGTGGFD